MEPFFLRAFIIHTFVIRLMCMDCNFWWNRVWWNREYTKKEKTFFDEIHASTLDVIRNAVVLERTPDQKDEWNEIFDIFLRINNDLSYALGHLWFVRSLKKQLEESLGSNWNVTTRDDLYGVGDDGTTDEYNQRMISVKSFIAANEGKVKYNRGQHLYPINIWYRLPGTNFTSNTLQIGVIPGRKPTRTRPGIFYIAKICQEDRSTNNAESIRFKLLDAVKYELKLKKYVFEPDELEEELIFRPLGRRLDLIHKIPCNRIYAGGSDWALIFESFLFHERPETTRGTEQVASYLEGTYGTTNRQNENEQECYFEDIWASFKGVWNIKREVWVCIVPMEYHFTRLAVFEGPSLSIFQKYYFLAKKMCTHTYQLVDRILVDNENNVRVILDLFTEEDIRNASEKLNNTVIENNIHLPTRENLDHPCATKFNLGVDLKELVTILPTRSRKSQKAIRVKIKKKRFRKRISEDLGRFDELPLLPKFFGNQYKGWDVIFDSLLTSEDIPHHEVEENSEPFRLVFHSLATELADKIVASNVNVDTIKCEKYFRAGGHIFNLKIVTSYDGWELTAKRHGYIFHYILERNNTERVKKLLLAIIQGSKPKRNPNQRFYYLARSTDGRKLEFEIIDRLLFNYTNTKILLDKINYRDIVTSRMRIKRKAKSVGLNVKGNVFF